MVAKHLQKRQLHSLNLVCLQEVDEKVRNQYIFHEFETADLNHDGVISIDEFYFYFYRELCFKFPILRSGVNPGRICWWQGDASEKHQRNGVQVAGGRDAEIIICHEVCV